LSAATRLSAIGGGAIGTNRGGSRAARASASSLRMKISASTSTRLGRVLINAQIAAPMGQRQKASLTWIFCNNDGGGCGGDH
jgi:hypothetical protein